MHKKPDSRSSKKRADTARPRRKMTEKRLRNIALYYCQRYVTSEAKLREHLANRLFREEKSPEEREQLSQEIPGIVKSLATAGLVNDREAASAKLRTALRSGYAKDAAVGVAARASRVDAATVEQELSAAAEVALPEIDFEQLDDNEQGAALASAALRRARRGPYRKNAEDPIMQRRDVAWLQRRGFRFDDIRKAMQIDDMED